MTQLPNPFLNPSVILPRTERSAVASKPPPAADATAAQADGGVESRHAIVAQPQAPARPASQITGAGLAPGPSEAISEPSMTMEVPEETPVSAPTKNPDAGVLATDHIHEIFHYVRKLMKQPPHFVLDEAAFMAEVEEVPLFIREDGYLKRQA